MIAKRIHRAGIAAALLALWLFWTTETPTWLLWVLFLAGLLLFVLPSECWEVKRRGYSDRRCGHDHA